MAASFSKSKSGKRYGHYFCHTHRASNFSSDTLHDALYEILEGLSFSQLQVELLSKSALSVSSEMKTRKEMATTDKKKAVGDIEQKIERVEQKLFENEIDSDTYKKWINKYIMGEKDSKLKRFLRKGKASSQTMKHWSFAYRYAILKFF